jgi:hypothetical protein
MENIVELFNNYNVHKYIKDIIHPIGVSVYNEIYVYIWFICIYNVFLFVIVMANLFLLIRLSSMINTGIPGGQCPI